MTFSSKYRAAREAFLTVADGHLLPCRSDPETWTKAPGEGNEDSVAAYRRVERAIEGCMGCTVFVECLDLAQSLDPDDQEITGVMAGEPYFPAGQMLTLHRGAGRNRLERKRAKTARKRVLQDWAVAKYAPRTEI